MPDEVGEAETELRHQPVLVGSQLSRLDVYRHGIERSFHPRAEPLEAGALVEQLAQHRVGVGDRRGCTARLRRRDTCRAKDIW